MSNAAVPVRNRNSWPLTVPGWRQAGAGVAAGGKLRRPARSPSMPAADARVSDAVQWALRQGRITPRQLAAFTWLADNLPPELRSGFSERWRSDGPAVATPKPPAQPGVIELRDFPFCDQTDNGPEGWRQCQTSSIAMALIYLRTPGIKTDLDYLKVVNRHGDTTAQEAHRQALAELGVRARFRQNLTHGEVLAELKVGLPVVVGALHHGPVSAPTGGGHYVVITGAGLSAWRVNDPYGELDLVNGGWTRQGNGAGRGAIYSFRNFDRRWLVEGPASGWGWVFS